jgi:hypothetical protein
MTNLPWGAIAGIQLPSMLVVYFAGHVLANGPSWLGFLFYAALVETLFVAAIALLGAYAGWAGHRSLRRSIVGACVGSAAPGAIIALGFAAGGGLTWQGAAFLLFLSGSTAAVTVGVLTVFARSTSSARADLGAGTEPELPLN